MLRFLRFLWKLFILGSAFGIGYIVGREHSFEEDEEWENESEDNAADKPADAAPAAGAAAAATAATAVTSTGNGSSASFQYEDAKAKAVAVVGDFNDWNKDKTPMTLENGVWKCSVSLKPGKHEYKFVVNNTDWITDPKCPETVADKYGGRSSVIEVR